MTARGLIATSAGGSAAAGWQRDKSKEATTEHTGVRTCCRNILSCRSAFPVCSVVSLLLPAGRGWCKRQNKTAQRGAGMMRALKSARTLQRIMISNLKAYGCLPAVLWLSACAPISPRQPAPVEPPPVPRETAVQAPAVVRLSAVGDIMLGGKGRALLEREGYDYPFRPTLELLRGADITIGNLETPLTERGEPLVDKQYRFRNPPGKVAPALRNAGFDIVSLANNHTLDYGYTGLEDTIEALEAYGIGHHGAGADLAAARRPVVFTLDNGQRVGFLAYSNTFPEEFWAAEGRPGTAFGHEVHVREDVGALAARGIDVIVVSFHWGRERQSALRGYQPLLARAAIDAGADLVIGHHPHILQGVERYKDGLVLYSLGNFTFNSYSPHVHTSAVAEVVFHDGRFHELVMTPLNINNFQVELQPQILSGAQAETVFAELDALSRPLGTGLTYADGRIYLRESEKCITTENTDGRTD